MEIIATATQTVAANQNVLFTDTVTNGNCSITHRAGSGLVTLRGTTAQCRARYKVSFGGIDIIPFLLHVFGIYNNHTLTMLVF